MQRPPDRPREGAGGVPGAPGIGDLIAGKYRVERVLGVGGMGVVVAAQHVQLDQSVAIKFLLPEALEQEGAVARFLREARAAVKLHSEHVVRIMDVGTLETGAPYVVMELLAGRDLGQVVDARGPLPVNEATDYVLQACDAIAEAHAVGIVHRDLKPANLFLTERPDGAPLVKVLDFGISKSTGFDASGHNKHLTATTAIMGSPQYMSPEQVRSSKNVDARTDVWAMGVILQQLVTGEVPFEADSILGVCAKIVSDPPRPPRAVRPDLSPEFEGVILACLVKDPAARLQSMGALARALAPFASPEGAALVGRIAKLSKVPTLPPTRTVNLVPGVPEPVPAAASGPVVAASGPVVAASGPVVAAITSAAAASSPALSLSTEADLRVPTRRRGPLVAMAAAAVVVSIGVVVAGVLFGRSSGQTAAPAVAVPRDAGLAPAAPLAPAVAHLSDAGATAAPAPASPTSPKTAIAADRPRTPAPPRGARPAPHRPAAPPSAARRSTPPPAPPRTAPEPPKPAPPKKAPSTELPDDRR